MTTYHDVTIIKHGKTAKKYKCPYCGCEWLCSPATLLGHSRKIVINNYNLYQQFLCPDCDTPMIVKENDDFAITQYPQEINYQKLPEYIIVENIIKKKKK